MYTIVALLKARPGKEAPLEELMAKLVAQTRQEPGNRRYQLFRSVEEPSTYLVYEQYADKDAFKAHGSSAHFQEAAAKFADILAGRIDVGRFQPAE